MAVVTGNANQVRIGPGKLYIAPFGSVLPVTLAAALDAAFLEVGFTTEGSSLTYTQSSDGVSVAERLRPIKSIITGVEMHFDFTMAQLSPTHLQLATNSPDSSITTTADNVCFTFPKSGGTSRQSIVWQSDDDLERMVLAKCFAGGDVTIPRRKGVDPAAIGLSFTVEENSTVSTTVNAVAALRDAYILTDPSLLV